MSGPEVGAEVDRLRRENEALRGAVGRLGDLAQQMLAASMVALRREDDEEASGDGSDG